MRLVGLVAAVMLALPVMTYAVPAGADPFESYREDTLLACIANAENTRADLRTCIGAGADPCIATDGAATSSYVLCWSNEAESWRALMVQAVGDLNQSNTGHDPARLGAANTAWEAWAEAECDYWAWEEGGGSGEQVERARCFAQLTAERAITLMERVAVL